MIRLEDKEKSEASELAGADTIRHQGINNKFK